MPCEPTSERERTGSGKGWDWNIPKIILVDGTNSPHLGNLGPYTDKLQADVGAGLDGQALVVGELRWGGVGVVDAVLGDGLGKVTQCQLTSRWETHVLQPGWLLTRLDVKMRRGPA